MYTRQLFILSSNSLCELVLLFSRDDRLLTHMESEVLISLVPMFPQLSARTVRQSILKPENRLEPFDEHMLLQRCIDDLLDIAKDVVDDDDGGAVDPPPGRWGAASTVPAASANTDNRGPSSASHSQRSSASSTVTAGSHRAFPRLRTAASTSTTSSDSYNNNNSDQAWLDADATRIMVEGNDDDDDVVVVHEKRNDEVVYLGCGTGCGSAFASPNLRNQPISPSYQQPDRNRAGVNTPVGVQPQPQPQPQDPWCGILDEMSTMYLPPPTVVNNVNMVNVYGSPQTNVSVDSSVNPHGHARLTVEYDAWKPASWSPSPFSGPPGTGSPGSFATYGAEVNSFTGRDIYNVGNTATPPSTSGLLYGDTNLQIPSTSGMNPVNSYGAYLHNYDDSNARVSASGSMPTNTQGLDDFQATPQWTNSYGVNNVTKDVGEVNPSANDDDDDEDNDDKDDVLNFPRGETAVF